MYENYRLVRVIYIYMFWRIEVLVGLRERMPFFFQIGNIRVAAHTCTSICVGRVARTNVPFFPECCVSGGSAYCCTPISLFDCLASFSSEHFFGEAFHEVAYVLPGSSLGSTVG